jgi:hypothetical protein
MMRLHSHSSNNRNTEFFDQITDRALTDGGFAPLPGGDYRPDATCWAILALSGNSQYKSMVAQACNRLASDQSSDGRLTLSPVHPYTIWPTSLAVLAWLCSPEHRANLIKAANFLIASTGTFFQDHSTPPTGHDSSIKGWPWIADTHSWVEPTAMAVMALSLAGYGDHDRVKEGVLLLLDRQLPHGGWNVGNTIVFEQELRPMPLSTGIAMNALKDHTSPEMVDRSINYLQNKITNLRTPRSLAWSLLGLGAWNARNCSTHLLIDACLKNQERYGGYDTESLSLLSLAEKSPIGLEGIFPLVEKS